MKITTKACYRFLSRSVLLQFILFLLKVCEFDKLCTRNEDSSTSLRLCHLPLLHSYSIVSLLLVSNFFAIGLSQCLSTYFAKHASFLPRSQLK